MTMSTKDSSNIELLISYGDVSISVNIIELEVKPNTNKQKIQTHIFFYDGQWIGPHKNLSGYSAMWSVTFSIFQNVKMGLMNTYILL